VQPTTFAALVEGRKAFFFEKKKQKTFGRFGFGLPGKAQSRLVKVFWFIFFQKRTAYLNAGITDQGSRK
jgi:hypothetical protein